MCRLKKILTGGLDQFFAQGFGNRLGLGMDLELVVDVFQVKGDGMKRDAQRLGGGASVDAGFCPCAAVAAKRVTRAPAVNSGGMDS